jgi:hypothetical protein
VSESLKLILISSGFLGGIVGLLLYVARLIFSGKYYPASWVAEQRNHYNEQLLREREISENYRKSSDNFVVALDRQREQLEKVLEGQDFVKDFVVALKEAMERDQRERRALPKGRSQ